MKRFFLICTVFLLFFFNYNPPTFSQELDDKRVLENTVEYIESFDTQIKINQDTSLLITEQIHYVTSVEKHGIYRYIPYRYSVNNETYTLPISEISVVDPSGTEIPFSLTKDTEFVTLQIGYPNKTFTGKQIYVINYTVDRAIESYDTYDELYWDITGEGWSFPILSSSAVVNSPYADITETACYVGTVGSSAQVCNIEQGTQNTTFFNDSVVDYGENFTVVVQLNPSNQLVFPSSWDLFIFRLTDNWMIFLFLLPTVVLFFAWMQKGRDFEFISQDIFDLDPNKPKKLLPMVSLFSRNPFVYEPLSELSPGEAGALLDERVDTKDIIAEILELARKKYLEIQAEEKKGFLSSSTDYVFIKLKEASANDSDLTAVQSYLFSKLFATKKQIKVSELKGSFHSTIITAKQKMEQALVSKNIYVSKPTTAKGLGIAFIVGFYFLVFFVFGQFFLSTLSVLVFVMILSNILLSLFFALQLGQKTAVGRNLYLQSKGLRESIKRGAWREKINEKNLFIEKVLPFAISLGVVKQLAKDMDDLDLQPPEYLKTSAIHNFSTAAFVSSFSNEVGSSLSYNPASSSRSGGSGFSGGGFSGGGGGGGGGGSW